jgi:hypothetical protein
MKAIGESSVSIGVAKKMASRRKHLLKISMKLASAVNSV